MTRKDAEQQEAIEKLRRWLKPGDTVYTILRHVSRSGMQRELGVVVFHRSDTNEAADGIDLHPNWLVAKAIDARIGKRDGIIVNGCGMDIVSNLGYALFPDGFGCIGQGCPSNDHSNGDRDYTPHPGCGIADKRGHRDHWHQSGAYALRQRWL